MPQGAGRSRPPSSSLARRSLRCRASRRRASRWRRAPCPRTPRSERSSWRGSTPPRQRNDRLRAAVSYLVLGLVAGLAAVERKGFLQAMLSRPIALGPLTGLALGDVAGGLYVAAPLELLWLGAVNLGAALPVHEALGTAAITGGTVLASRALRTE